MVALGRLMLSQRGGKVKNQFIDKLRIYAKGGSGGQGLPSYGGVGGKGGNVYVESSSKMTFRRLKNLHPSKRFKAKEGENSRLRCLQGARGNDVIIPVPLGVCVVDDKRNVVADLDKLGQRVLVADGGSGGNSENDWKGSMGQTLSLNLELKLIADVGFVGFPNAGKSTLLEAMSRSKPKIAEYPFTTIRPQVGVCQYSDLRQISLADLPGLVEGAHCNVGMGHKFLRHVERTKLLLFVVDVHGFRLSPRHPFRTAFQTVMLLNKELELYKQHLVEKPAIVAFNKLDMEGAGERLEEALELLKAGDRETRSSLQDMNIQPEQPIIFKDIISISAKEHSGIEKLKTRIREIIDDETEREEDGEENMEGPGG
ncbi:GTP-binding protein 10-like [Apostichopus japonicus]|uniref:GTP-binding protein 10-like n=1 Tax=Stichopus japonicus TaxID=307972 RepID=UPI003AB20388